MGLTVFVWCLAMHSMSFRSPFLRIPKSVPDVFSNLWKFQNFVFFSQTLLPYRFVWSTHVKFLYQLWYRGCLNRCTFTSNKTKLLWKGSDWQLYNGVKLFYPALLCIWQYYAVVIRAVLQFTCYNNRHISCVVWGQNAFPFVLLYFSLFSQMSNQLNIGTIYPSETNIVLCHVHVHTCTQLIKDHRAQYMENNQAIIL